METRGTKKEIDVHHIDVLDGIRALSIGLIFWFHLWQQSWLMPVLDTPFLGKLGLSSSISLDFIPRGGFLFVDLMLLLSAFCLFLPHARAVFLGEPAPEIKSFYSKRAARILPCYYLCVLIIFFGVALPSGAYASSKQMLTELFSTLTFTQVFFPQVLLGTRLNGVLWTAAIEMQFYLIFPLLAWCFRKRPLITYLAMTGVSLLYLYGFALPDPEGLRVTLNQLPGFMGVFANGMLAAYGFVWLSTKVTRRLAISIPATLLAVFCLGLILYCEKVAPRTDPVQVWQASNRFSLSLLFALFIISSALSTRWFRFLLGNRMARFLAGISYNVYIWHQWLFVKLKDWRIPFWQGDTPPNFLGDLLWQRQYTLICVLAALGVAVLVTYCFEKPVCKLILKRKDSHHASSV